MTETLLAAIHNKRGCTPCTGMQPNEPTDEKGIQNKC